MNTIFQQSITAACLTIACIGLPGDALAWKQVQDEWQKLYLAEHPDKDFVKLCRKQAKCHVCHQGKSKKNSNPYGKQFEGKLTKNDRKDKDKIVNVLKEIGKLRSDPKDDQSLTYEQLIAESQLPGGDLKSVKQEPKKKADG
ncbi:MAG: hypothetical protein KDA37_01695 [Planctomycetales bacterium]|nr:hypothetical protein [Planctomycetales bacterium]